MLERKRCEFCKRVLKRLCRKNQLYCGNKCNQRSYRERHPEPRPAAPASVPSIQAEVKEVGGSPDAARAEAPRQAVASCAQPALRAQPPPIAPARSRPSLHTPAGKVGPSAARSVAPAGTSSTVHSAPSLEARAIGRAVSRPVIPSGLAGAGSRREPANLSRAGRSMPPASTMPEFPASCPTMPDLPVSHPPMHDPVSSPPTSPQAGGAEPAASSQAPPPTEPGGLERLEPLRREMLRALEAVSYQIGEAVEGRLEPLWFPEPGKPIRRLDGSVSDRPFALRPIFEPPVVPKDALYAIQLLDAEGRDVRLPMSLIRGVRLEAWPPRE